MPNFISEDQIEQELVRRLRQHHGFEILNCYTADPEEGDDRSGRASKRDVILVDRLREAAVRLNPHLPPPAIEDALEKLLDRRQAMSLMAANREIYDLLRDGVPVEYDDAEGQKQQEGVRLIDFNPPAAKRPDANRYLAVRQLWVRGERGFRRPDVLLYINGLPLVFIELKNSNVKLANAHADNIVNYRPQRGGEPGQQPGGQDEVSPRQLSDRGHSAEFAELVALGQRFRTRGWSWIAR